MGKTVRKCKGKKGKMMKSGKMKSYHESMRRERKGWDKE